MKYAHANSKLKIRSMELKNRIVRTAHGTTIGSQEPGGIGPKFIAYHLARAKGGIGLALLEVCSVHPSCYGPMRSYEPAIADGYKRLVDAVAPTGAKLMQQLWHAGIHGRPIDGSPPWGPSKIASPLVGVPAVEMTKMMIDELVEAYAKSAKVALDAGIDGIEVHGGHSYLIQQFLSPALNHREDDYGGSLENRLRFPIEVLEAIRGELGEDRPLSIRLSADSKSMSAEESQRTLAGLEATGLLDMINYSQGSYFDMHAMIGTMAAPTGYMQPTSDIMAEGTKLPRLVTGRFRTLEEADQLIRLGQADLVGMVRATIADPELVNKSLAGREEDVRPCIACNQACVANINRGGLTGMMPMSCAVNPTTSLETIYSDDVVGTAGTIKKVLVVGGGPAGMEAARISAMRGHDVTLVEASPDLGGQLKLARRAPFRHTIADIVDWQETQLGKLGVSLQMNAYMDADDVMAFGADTVIIATGSAPDKSGFNLANPANPTKILNPAKVLSGHDVFERQITPTGTVAISDDVGHYEGISVAETLLERGAKSVVFVCRGNSLAPQMEFTFAAQPAKERLHATNRFRVIPNSFIHKVGAGDTIELGTVYGTTSETIDAEYVVLITYNSGNDDVYNDLTGRHEDVHIVGDARSPRYIETAIREANFAARAI